MPCCHSWSAMSYRRKLNLNVVDAAVQRMMELYKTDHRIIVAFSGGKDSGVAVEICRIAAKRVGRSSIEVWMLDDEIMYPGTFEYAERIAEQKDINFHWMVAGEPMPAVWNRQSPYWWIFDDRIDPDQWVRKPPAYAKKINAIDLYEMVNPISFPPPKGKRLFIVIGNRVEESRARMMSIHSTSSFITGKTPEGAYKVYPIYDWTVGDIWKAVADNKWDYNSAYSVLFKMGMKPADMRIAPPTMTWFGMMGLQIASKAWPKWYDKVEARIPGAKAIAHFGLRAVMPLRRSSETWKECYQRECIDDAPPWIAKRAKDAIDRMLSAHANHSNKPFPEVDDCTVCGTTQTGSWRSLANVMYTGDPYSLKATFLPYVQPNEFRPDDTRVWKFDPAGFR